MDSFSYLKPQYIGSVVSGEIKSSLKELGDYTEIWSITLIKLLAHIGTLVEKSRSIDSVSMLLVLVSKFHALRCMLKTYYDKLNSRDSHISDEITKESMWNVYKLFSLYFIDKHSGEFQQFKIFTPDQISKVVQPQLLALLPIVRKDCIGLTDSFELPDAMLNSPIGYFDGDIYHNYFNEVCRNNPVEADGAGKPSYHALLSSMLGRGFEFDQKLGGAANAEILSKINK